MASRTKTPSRIVGLAVSCAVTFIGTALWSPRASADPLAVGNGAIFRLNPESAFEQGCYEPCMCPIMIRAGVRGTLKLIHTGFDGVVDTYAVEDVNWTVPADNNPLAELRIIGSGTYRIGSPDPITLVQHRMELDLRVGVEPVQHFDSGWVPVADMSKIVIAVSLNGMYCWDTVIRIDASHVPAAEIQPYALVNGSTFQRGCFDPCDCPLESERTLLGTFLRVPLIESLPVTEFAVVDVRWHVPFNSAGDTIPIAGFGVYQLLGDFALQHRLALDLIVGNEERTHFDSGALIGGEAFPRIDAVVSVNGMVCLDTVLHVVADPVNVQACGSPGSPGCPPGTFCKRPVGQCANDAAGVCAPIPTGCPAIWDPVCGCDGATYGNECEADAAAMSIAHWGPCETVCEPAGTGFGCVPLACSTIPEEQCIPSVLQIDWATGAITTMACDCLDWNFCHIEFGDASPIAVGFCPNGGVCEVIGVDTNGDGIDDQFRAECAGTGACCSDIGGSPFPVPVCTEARQDVCEAGGMFGVFLGVGTTCDPVEACCLTFGGDPAPCVDLNPQCCAVFSGVARGPGTTCADGACGQVCGGIAGIPCDASSAFCKFPEGTCNGSDIFGVCTPIPTGCPDVWEPVCGCDGVTYGNVCEADVAGVSIDHRGACAQMCGGLGPAPPCGDGFFCKYPGGVCGDGAFPGVCTPIPNACPDVWQPVCGCNGVTYGNECESDAAGTSVAAPGECPWTCCDPDAAPPCIEGPFCCADGTWACGDGGGTGCNAPGIVCGPVCGGITGLPCYDAGAFCKFPEGTCGAADLSGMCTPVPGTGCPEIYDPVCGCDGVTYSNECEADAARVSVAHHGPCPGTPCAATRFFSNVAAAYCPQVPQTVRIVLTPPATTTVVAVEDDPPDGWVVSNISDNGTYDTANGKVKWGPFFAPAIPAALTYDVTPSNDTVGVACFAGLISVDGVNELICGDACIGLSCPPHMAADTPQPPCSACPIGDCTSCPDGTCRDGRITLCEVIGYACAWKVGCNDDLAGMARAAYVWRHGECYCWDEAQGNWFPAACPPPDSGLCGAPGAGGTLVGGDAAGGTAVIRTDKSDARTLTRKPGPNVRIAIEAPAGASVMALEIQIPKGWRVTGISDSGEWDEVRRKVKWGPFFENLSRTVSFTAIPPALDPTVPLVRLSRIVRPGRFSGTVSFDGINQPLVVR